MVDILFPVKCFTCGKPISYKYEDYVKSLFTHQSNDTTTVLDDKTSAVFKALRDVGIHRECCRKVFISHYDSRLNGCNHV